MRFDLIIWDCDGCLVDSESMDSAVCAEYLTAHGYPVSHEQYIRRFSGRSLKYALGEIELETGMPFQQTFPYEECRAKINAVLAENLLPVAGVRAVLEKLETPLCVASGSWLERIKETLGKTGLLSFFGKNIFSATQVRRPKPAPDVFLFAAKEMGVDPSKCLVIEDSVYGVQAAKAAGMAVFAFLGASHVDEDWRGRVEAETPDAVFDDMAQLPSLIGKLA